MHENNSSSTVHNPDNAAKTDAHSHSHVHHHANVHNHHHSLNEKNQRRRWIKAILIILIILAILFLSRCSVTVNEVQAKEVPKTRIKTVYEPVQNCEEREYGYSYSWEGWDIGENTIATNFRLSNLEKKAGTFKVDFAFFDESKYRFDDYKGLTYDLVQDKLPWDKASMRVDNVERKIDPEGNVLIVPSVTKADKNGVYWAYAYVHPPTLNDCRSETVAVEVNTTYNSTEAVKTTTVKSMSLWSIIVMKIRD